MLSGKVKKNHVILQLQGQNRIMAQRAFLQEKNEELHNSSESEKTDDA